MKQPAEWGRPGAQAPTAARVYDALLGGHDHYAADEDLAARLEAASGDGTSVRELARINRSFILSAARWAASMLAVDQFIDLGCGLPLKPAVHDTARQGCPEATVVYVDKDPMVLSHVSALQSGEGLGAVLADASDPEAVLRSATRLGLLDPARPACVILGATLSTMPAGTARGAVEACAAALAPGSAVVISCASWADPETGARMAELYSAAGPWHNHLMADVASFFADGLRIVRGRVADVSTWPMLPEETPGAAVIGGIGILGGAR